mgnify:CR=1 FL=1|tara:strand:+ start:2205 stop:2414 length:210 start_codon:yes stop_codon:yes gene_type:complete
MALIPEEAIVKLETTNAALVAAVIESVNNVDSRIAAAVELSENETIIPLANSVTYLITTQTLFINLLNK